MAFEKKVPEWNAPGTEPANSLKNSGFEPGYKPPADIFNWFWHGVSEALSELQGEAAIGRQTLPSGTDLNTVTTSGCYRLNSNNLNAPNGSDYGQLLVIHGGGDTIAQMLVCYTDGAFWTRGGNPADVSGAGSWHDWKKISTTNDVPGQLLYSKFSIESTEGGTELDDLLDDIISGMGTTTMRHVSVHDLNGYSALTGGTAFITIQKFNDNNVVVSAYKYGGVALRIRVKTSGTWGDWFGVYSAANKPTPDNIGAVKKSGDTMTGQLVAPNVKAKGAGGWPEFTLETENGGVVGGLTSTNEGRMELYTRKPGGTYSEWYMMPSNADDLTASKWYSILTSKNPVTVAQGGTGATDAATARTNLGAVSKSGDTMTGTLDLPSLTVQNPSTNYPSLTFKAKGVTNRSVLIQPDLSDGVRRFVVYQYPSEMDGSSTRYAEAYRLPATSGTLTKDANYSILTSKNAVTVAQGGTGATTAREAQYNLLSDIGSTTSAVSDDTTFVLKRNSTASAANGALSAKSAADVWTYIQKKIEATYNVTKK